MIASERQSSVSVQYNIIRVILWDSALYLGYRAVNKPADQRVLFDFTNQYFIF